MAGTAADSAALGVTLSTASIDAALDQVRSMTEALGSNASVLAIREEFTNDLVNSLEEGAQKLVGTDLNEEAANILTQQTRGQLSAAATGIAARSEASILQLF
ncbi:MAG: flagellin [Rhodospirillales bacterium]|nr:flagellin [Rhodospirillales bacterium]